MPGSHLNLTFSCRSSDQAECQGPWATCEISNFNLKKDWNLTLWLMGKILKLYSCTPPTVIILFQPNFFVNVPRDRPHKKLFEISYVKFLQKKNFFVTPIVMILSLQTFFLNFRVRFLITVVCCDFEASNLFVCFLKSWNFNVAADGKMRNCNILETDNRRAKPNEVWDLRVVATFVWGTFDLLVFTVILGSFSALVSK